MCARLDHAKSARVDCRVDSGQTTPEPRQRVTTVSPTAKLAAQVPLVLVVAVGAVELLPQALVALLLEPVAGPIVAHPPLRRGDRRREQPATFGQHVVPVGADAGQNGQRDRRGTAKVAAASCQDGIRTCGGAESV